MTHSFKPFTSSEIQKSITELKNAVLQAQASITQVTPAHPDLVQDYQKTLEEFGQLRGAPLYYPYLSSGLGNGSFVQLADGSVKYDLINGIGVHHLGHSHPKIIEACLEASLTDTVMQGNLQQNSQSAEFLKIILNGANQFGAQLAHGFLTCTGVMAGENALKLTFQKNSPRDRVFVFEKCFMGRTLALSQFTDKDTYRQGLPLNYKIDYVPFFDPQNPSESTEKAIVFIQKQIKRYPHQHAAMSFELILGEGGFYFGTSAFYKAIMQELKKHDIAILVDEVQSFARTSQLFAFQHFGLDEFVDIVWFGKASQVCGTLFRTHFKPKPGLLSQTFTGSSSAIASGIVVLKTLLENNFFGAQGKISTQFEKFETRFKGLAQKYPHRIHGPFGVGAMLAFSLDDGSNETTQRFIKTLFQNGVMAFFAGDTPCRVRFLPSVGTLSDQHIDEIFKIIELTLNQMN